MYGIISNPFSNILGWRVNLATDQESPAQRQYMYLVELITNH